MAIDRIDWHWDSTEKIYRKNHNITGELTEEQENDIGLLAGNHIGLFIRWVIEHNFEGEDSNEESCQRVRNGTMTGTEYLLSECDGKLWDEDICEDVLPFVKEYYDNNYFSDYSDCCYADADEPYSVISSDGDYFKLKVKIDHAYDLFLENLKMSGER